MRQFLQKNRRDSVQQLQLNLGSEENIALDQIVEEELIELMAEMLLAVTAPGKETGDDRASS
jgi:hypothetical protein